MGYRVESRFGPHAQHMSGQRQSEPRPRHFDLPITQLDSRGFNWYTESVSEI
jgi:hypothetical protein